MNCNDKKKDLDSTTGGDFEAYDKKTRKFFEESFVKERIYRKGRRVSAGSSEQEIQKCYEHLTTKGCMEYSARLPDLRRYESIYILPHILTSEECDNCRNYYVWEKKEKYLKEKIFCVETGYFIVLHKRDHVYKIVSAYIIESESKKRRLIEEFNKYGK